MNIKVINNEDTQYSRIATGNEQKMSTSFPPPKGRITREHIMPSVSPDDK